MQTLHLSGSPKTIGREYGRQLHDKILDIAQYNLTPQRRETHRQNAAKSIPILRNYLRELAPFLVEEIEGLAETTGLTNDDAFWLSHIEDISGPVIPWSDGVPACTGILFQGGPDGPILANSMDCNPKMKSWFILLTIDPEKGLRHVVTTRAGEVGACRGMNEVGLAIGGNSAPYNNSFGAGLGLYTGMRLALQTCSTTDEVIRLFGAHGPPSKGHCFVIMDRKGNGAVIESTHGAFAIHHLEKNYLYATNRFRDPSLVHLNASRGIKNALSCETREKLLKNFLSQPERKYGLEDAQAALRLQADNGYGVCNPTWSTLFAVIAEPKSRRFFLADGLPSKTEFKEVWKA